MHDGQTRTKPSASLRGEGCQAEEERAAESEDGGGSQKAEVEARLRQARQARGSELNERREQRGGEAEADDGTGGGEWSIRVATRERGQAGGLRRLRKR